MCLELEPEAEFPSAFLRQEDVLEKLFCGQKKPVVAVQRIKVYIFRCSGREI